MRIVKLQQWEEASPWHGWTPPACSFSFLFKISRVSNLELTGKVCNGPVMGLEIIELESFYLSCCWPHSIRYCMLQRVQLMALSPSLADPLGHCPHEGSGTQLICQNFPVHMRGCQAEQQYLEGFLNVCLARPCPMP